MFALCPLLLNSEFTTDQADSPGCMSFPTSNFMEEINPNTEIETRKTMIWVQIL